MAHFFFQAEDGIRDLTVTGVQTCALPISTPCKGSEGRTARSEAVGQVAAGPGRRVARGGRVFFRRAVQIGRASCRERVQLSVGDGGLVKKRSDGALVRVSMGRRDYVRRLS